MINKNILMISLMLCCLNIYAGKPSLFEAIEGVFYGDVESNRFRSICNLKAKGFLKINIDSETLHIHCEYSLDEDLRHELHVKSIKKFFKEKSKSYYLFGKVIEKRVAFHRCKENYDELLEYGRIRNFPTSLWTYQFKFKENELVGFRAQKTLRGKLKFLIEFSDLKREVDTIYRKEKFPRNLDLYSTDWKF